MAAGHYHLHVSHGAKGSQSGAAKHDYIMREGKYSKRSEELVLSGSGNMPDWATEYPRMYWQAADQHERKNGRVFTEIEFALPKELSQEQAEAVAQEFVSQVCGPEKLPHSWAIHRGDNPDHLHCHLSFHGRSNDGLNRSAETWFKRANSKDPEKGGAKKSREIISKGWLEGVRVDWEKTANAALERAGSDVRIDHRTNEARGIERPPEPKLGPSVVAMERKGIRTQFGTEALQRASAADRKANLKRQEVAFERRRNSQGQNAGRTAGRSNPERGGHGDVSGQYVASAPADRRERGWLESLIGRLRKPKPVRNQDGNPLETARLETLGRYVDRGGRRVAAGSHLLETWGRNLKRALDRFKNHECREAVERHNAALLETDRRRQAESERAARLEKQRLEAAERERLRESLLGKSKAELKKYHTRQKVVARQDPSPDLRAKAAMRRDVALQVWKERGFAATKTQSRGRSGHEVER